jgi:hypothetical protein
MSRRMASTDWVTLAAAAQNEQDPMRFMQLIKQLYDVVNMREEEQDLDCEVTTSEQLLRAA